MRILCLILASDTAPEYLQFQKLWRRFMKLDPGFDCYFYKGHPDLTQPYILDEDTLWIRTSETLGSVYEKTLLAFEYFLPRLSQYDFVFRSNLSTLISFPHLRDFCSDVPRTNACAAFIGFHGAERVQFPAGNGFLLSTDLVRRLVRERPPLIEQDDVTIGYALKEWGVPIIEFIRPDYMSNNVWIAGNYEKFAKGHRLRAFPPNRMMFSWRMKTDNRDEDIAVMSVLVKRLYGV